jgi:two-component system nitrogen regulation response regulator GlnG
MSSHPRNDDDAPSTVVGAGPDAPDDASDEHRSLVGLTMVWHPDVRRVGDRGVFDADRTAEVSRRTMPFDAGCDVMLSRSPFLKVRWRGDGLEVLVVGNSMTVELDGATLSEPRFVSAAELTGGVIVTLGHAVVVCLHRARASPRRGAGLWMVGSSDVIEGVRRQIAKVADLDVPVLVRGETGTGKELVARAIATASKGATSSFVAVNMAAIPQTTATDELFGHERGAFTGATERRAGYFGEADGGVIFLDEIGAASAETQAMLLRVLETREIRPLGARASRSVSVRVLSATDADLEAAVVAGQFSEPLLHRLAGYQIVVPPLRERREDIGGLFLHFLRKELAATGDLEQLDWRELKERPWLGAAEMARIARGPFPGNVRQLRNVARQLAISNRGQRYAKLDATVEALVGGPWAMGGPVEGGVAVGRGPRVTDDQIRDALRSHHYNVSAAADALGIQRSTLYDRARHSPDIVRSAAELSDDELLAAYELHRGHISAMATALRVPPKPLRRRLDAAMARRPVR